MVGTGSYFTILKSVILLIQMFDKLPVPVQRSVVDPNAFFSYSDPQIFCSDSDPDPKILTRHFLKCCLLLFSYCMCSGTCTTEEKVGTNRKM
jgi:hypothetical protein